MEIWIVGLATGSYEDFHEYVLAAYSTRAAAEEAMTRFDMELYAKGFHDPEKRKNMLYDQLRFHGAFVDRIGGVNLYVTGPFPLDVEFKDLPAK